MQDPPEIKLTKDQQDRLNAIPAKLDDILRDYEPIRKAYEAQKALDPNTPTNPLVLQRMVFRLKLNDFAAEVVKIRVNINQSLGLNGDQFRDHLESDARNFKKWLSATLSRKIHKNHLSFLDWAAVEKAVDDEVDFWVGEEQRAIPVPLSWEPVSNEAEPTETQQRTQQTGDPWNLRLSRARKSANLSRPKLALRIKTGGFILSPDSIKKHEEGKAYPKASARQAYSNAFNVPIEDLFPPA
jgi:hypothetical protein